MLNYQEEEGWDHINQFNPVTFSYLSQVKTWISNVMSLSFFMFNELMLEVISHFINNGKIVDFQYLNFLLIIKIISVIFEIICIYVHEFVVVDVFRLKCRRCKAKQCYYLFF